MDGRRQTALVLSGGGSTGFLFEIDVLAALEDALPRTPLHQYFDCFVGTSAGAVALLANGARPAEAHQVLREDLDSPSTSAPADLPITAPQLAPSAVVWATWCQRSRLGGSSCFRV